MTSIQGVNVKTIEQRVAEAVTIRESGGCWLVDVAGVEVNNCGTLRESAESRAVVVRHQLAVAAGIAVAFIDDRADKVAREAEEHVTVMATHWEPDGNLLVCRNCGKLGDAHTAGKCPPAIPSRRWHKMVDGVAPFECTDPRCTLAQHYDDDGEKMPPTSAPPARELTEAEIDRCSAAACITLNPDIGGRKPCGECLDAGRAYAASGTPNPPRDAHWRAAFDKAAAAIRATKE